MVGVRRARGVFARFFDGARLSRCGAITGIGRNRVSGWRRAFTWRWGGYFALAVVFAILCVSLGTWQVGRRDEALQEVNRVQANFDAEPVPIGHALPQLNAFDRSQKWLRVRMSGSYLSDAQLLVRNRPLDGHPGFEVLSPFRIDDGTVFVVDRGWLATGSRDDVPDAVPLPPEGRVTVVARLKAGEPQLPNRSAPEGQIATIELANIRDRINAPTYTEAYGLLDSEDPAPTERPIAVVKPVPDEGVHLSYAFQWFLFSALGFFGLGYALLQEFRVVTPRDSARSAPNHVVSRRRPARRSDADVEDELLGSQASAMREK